MEPRWVMWDDCKLRFRTVERSKKWIYSSGRSRSLDTGAEITNRVMNQCMVFVYQNLTSNLQRRLGHPNQRICCCSSHYN